MVNRQTEFRVRLATSQHRNTTAELSDYLYTKKFLLKLLVPTQDMFNIKRMSREND